MRLISKSALFAFVAVFAMSVVAASAASAALPEFKPVPTKKKVTAAGKSTVWEFDNGVWTISCTASSATGEITSARDLGKFVLVFTGCTNSGEGAANCPVHSPGAKAGELITQGLNGELGTVATSEAPSGVGLRLKSEGKRWMEIVENACGGEDIFGTVAVEVSTIGVKSKTLKLAFHGEREKPLKEITLDSGVKEKLQLEMALASGGLNGTTELTFEEALEVT